MVSGRISPYVVYEMKHCTGCNKWYHIEEWTSFKNSLYCSCGKRLRTVSRDSGKNTGRIKVYI